MADKIDKALDDVEETLGVNKTDEETGDINEIQETPKPSEAKSLVTTQLAKIDRESRIKYVDKLFSAYKKLSNLRETIRLGNKSLGEVLKELDAIYDSGNIEFAADQYRHICLKIIDMIGQDYVEKFQYIVQLIMQLLNEFDIINKKAEELLIKAEEKNEKLTAENAKFKVENEFLRGKELQPLTISSLEDTSNDEKTPEIKANEKSSEVTDKDEEEKEKLLEAFKSFAKKSKNPIRDLNGLLSGSSDTEKEIINKVIKEFEQIEKDKAEATAEDTSDSTEEDMT